jgi:hypothetical protein
MTRTPFTVSHSVAVGSTRSVSAPSWSEPQWMTLSSPKPLLIVTCVPEAEIPGTCPEHRLRIDWTAEQATGPIIGAAFTVTLPALHPMVMASLAVLDADRAPVMLLNDTLTAPLAVTGSARAASASASENASPRTAPDRNPEPRVSASTG